MGPGDDMSNNLAWEGVPSDADLAGAVALSSDEAAGSRQRAASTGGQTKGGMHAIEETDRRCRAREQRRSRIAARRRSRPAPPRQRRRSARARRPRRSPSVAPAPARRRREADQDRRARHADSRAWTSRPWQGRQGVLRLRQRQRRHQGPADPVHPLRGEADPAQQARSHGSSSRATRWSASSATRASPSAARTGSYYRTKGFTVIGAGVQARVLTACPTFVETNIRPALRDIAAAQALVRARRQVARDRVARHVAAMPTGRGQGRGRGQDPGQEHSRPTLP